MCLSRRQFVSWAALGSVALAAGSLGRPARGANREVNLYTSRHYGTDEKLYDLFKQKTGITVNWVQGNADEIVQRIRSEGSNSPADIFMTVDAARLWRAQNEGFFQPIQSQTLSKNIPESLRDPEGYWFGLTKRARGDHVQQGQGGSQRALHLRRSGQPQVAGQGAHPLLQQCVQPISDGLDHLGAWDPRNRKWPAA